MHATFSDPDPTPGVARGEVIADAGSAAIVRLRDGRSVRVAVCHEHGGAVGDELVVARDADGWFSVGTLRRTPRDVVTVEAARRLVLRAPEGIELSVGETRAHLEPGQLELASERAAISLGETVFRGQTVRAAVERARVTAGVLETEAERLVSRAKQRYADVEEIAQLRAGRIRQMARGAMHLLSGRAVIRGEEEVAIDGDKINLG